MTDRTIQTLYDEQILVDCNETMVELAHERVCGVVKERNMYFLKELCDGYFGIKLTKQKCINISNFFKNLSEKC